MHQVGSNFALDLSMKIVGGKAKAGQFSYSGPGRCSASELFVAKHT
ncbi:MAG: hypothetical protein JWO46_403 [Nocardioidaceae bacterium]|nr:hypothetical protein [Nocardioidaceae bacterium]